MSTPEKPVTVVRDGVQVDKPSQGEEETLGHFATAIGLMSKQPILLRGSEIDRTAPALPAGISRVGIILEGTCQSDPATTCTEIVRSQVGLNIFANMHIFFQETGEQLLTTTPRSVALPHYMLCSGIFFNERNPPAGDFQFFETRLLSNRCYVYATYW